ncbi:MAG: tRNA pseudouridine(55) synthase TruB [Methanoregulaceae archaeon]|nr:tRNA pseudouridine(55) synthase TruB [Methanoregulaceae archaeon]
MLGVVLIDKPLGITSHDVIARLRRKFQTRRIGHAGTLDPLATGLLVVAVGPATRFLQYLPLEPKEYVGTIRFGVETTTQDAEGDVVAEKPVPSDLMSEIAEVLAEFKGSIQQLPPLYSAVKKEGKPLYVYARRGEEVEREHRTVFISEAELLAQTGNEVDVRVVCSGGTYMRTWAHDLGQRLGCGAHLSALRRTRVGKFAVEDAVTLEEVEPGDLRPLVEALPPVPLVEITHRQADAIRHGQAIGFSRPPAGLVCGLVGPDGDVIGMARIQGQELQPECVIPVLGGGD